MLPNMSNSGQYVLQEVKLGLWKPKKLLIVEAVGCKLHLAFSAPAKVTAANIAGGDRKPMTGLRGSLIDTGPVLIHTQLVSFNRDQVEGLCKSHSGTAAGLHRAANCQVEQSAHSLSRVSDLTVR